MTFRTRRISGQLLSIRGATLIEALVAVAVMGFGMLGVLGMQNTLRVNADVSRQRSEAVRIAQETIEAFRRYSVIPTTSGARSYDQIVSAVGTVATAANANTSFTVSTAVDTLPSSANAAVTAEHKRITVNVQWRDRNDELQTVQLVSMVSPVAPEIAAGLSAAADASPVQQQNGRHPTIPSSAVNFGSDSSSFAPPGATDGLTWTFNNLSGFITQFCTTTAGCTDVNARLLSGYVRFSTGATQPTGADAEAPVSAALIATGNGDSVGVSVDVSEPSVTTVQCFQSVSATFVTYYCAVPVNAPTLYWSGRANLVLPTGFNLANSLSDANANRYRVCRYTPSSARSIPHLLVNANPSLIRNEDHPLDYYRVGQSLIGQNFLVISAGNGGTNTFTCPDDDAGTPDVSGSTWHHQPSGG
jgi:Tfp pilus assembly protein PilV